MELKAKIKTYPTVVVYCWGKGCKGCDTYGPIFEQVRTESKDPIEFMKIDISEQRVRDEVDFILAGKQEKVILGKPTTLLFRNGCPAKIELGFMTAAYLRDWIKN